MFIGFILHEDPLRYLFKFRDTETIRDTTEA